MPLPRLQEVDPSSLLKAGGWLLTYHRGALESEVARYNFLAALALSAINGSCLPCCHRTTKVVQLLDCNLFWAEFPPERAGKMLALQGLLVGGGVTQQAAAAAFAAAGSDPDSGSLRSLQAVLRPLAAKHFMQMSCESVAKRQRM